MVWIKQLKVVGVLMVLAGIVTACSISYKFNGSSIDYTKVKTISFENFPNRSAGFVWGPMENMFNTALQDIYMQQTRLKQVKRSGDLQLSGEKGCRGQMLLREWSVLRCRGSPDSR